MTRGVYSRVVKADLGFLLGKWPNHYPGLQALIKYDLHGGRDYPGDYTDIPTECYFARARRFVPDDPQVMLLEGYYFSKKGKPQRAIKAYQDALAINPWSAEANYLLGLLYFDLKEFDKANECAQKAYMHDYPLPGLKTRLQEIGHWAPLPLRSAEGTASPAPAQIPVPPGGT